MTTALEALLAANGWADAERSPVAGDLSARRYTRLTRCAGDTVILMEDSNGASLAAFARMTTWLLDIDLSAPRILANDATSGLLLLEDFGDLKLTGVINEAPETQAAHYEIAVDTLLRIRNQPAPDLPRPDAAALVEATRLADEWYPDAGAVALDEIRDVLRETLDDILAAPATVSLRDFHTDNVIWLPERDGVARLGLLDYQDAFLTHPAYDLMSLLTDARIGVPDTVAEATLKTYAERSGDSLHELRRAVSVLGVQRNLRILGIFCRAAHRDRKPQYLPALPRVRAHVARCLAHPAFAAVAPRLDAAIPQERLTTE